MKRPSILKALAAGLCLCSSLATADPPSADEQASRMLAALGGRTAWAAASNTVNDSQQNRAGERNWRRTREGRIEPVPEQVIADDVGPMNIQRTND